MRLAGLELNATRIVAVGGPADAAPRSLPLDGDHSDIPVALSLEAKHAQVGRAGLALCRRLPHLACLDIPAFLGEPRQWVVGRHRLDAAKALTLIVDKIQPGLSGAKALGVAVPGYLNPTQLALLRPILERTKAPIPVTIPAPLALAYAAHLERGGEGLCLVVDIDDHAISLAVVRLEKEQARMLEGVHLPGLGLRSWKETLLDAVSDRCVRHSRRDPRDSGAAEQSLYEQIEEAMAAWKRGELVEFVIRSAPWFQNLLIRPEEAAPFCARLARGVLDAAKKLPVPGYPDQLRTIVLSAAASRLPGLEKSLRTLLSSSPSEASREEGEAAEATIRPPWLPATEVLVMPAGAAAETAFRLALRCSKGELAPGHYDEVLPLPAGPRLDQGPPRILYKGRELLITAGTFSIGKGAECSLPLTEESGGAIARRHCDVEKQGQTCILRDRGLTGTFINEQRVNGQAVLTPGDWIRIGPGGPVLRFLGEPADKRRAGATA